MKNISVGLIASIGFFWIMSCGKTTRDTVDKFDKVDFLFSQLKQDTLYQSYYAIMRFSSQIIMDNAKKSKQNDTLILNNKKLSLNEKFQQAGYSNYETIQENTNKLFVLYTKISQSYPDFKTLTDSENKKLITLSNKYFNKPN